MSERHEQRLRSLLTETAESVVPGDRLGAILAETEATDALAARRRRRGWFAVGGTAIATAAAVTAFAVLGQNPPETAPDLPSVTQPTGTAEPTPADPTPTDDGAGEPTAPSGPESTPPADGETVAVPLYFAGETPFGPRLYREFQRVDADQRLLAAATATVSGAAADPDYRSLWPAGAEVEAVHFDGIGADGTIEVHLADQVSRPDGMTDDEAAIALEQVIYTLQGVVGERAPVWFKVDGNPTAEVLGRPTSEPLANGELMRTLALVNITSPVEGEVVSGDTLEVTGVANSFEATVQYRLQRYEGTHIVAQSYFMTTDWMGERLFPFEGTVDISGAPPGRYILTVSTDDPSGEGNFYTDSKIIEIR